MAEARRRWSWRSWLPDVSAALSRFPLGVLLAGFLTIYKLWAGDAIEPDDKILGTLAASFLWVVAVDLFVESQGRTQRARGIAWIAGIAVIALLFHFKWEAWLFPPLLFGSLLLPSAWRGSSGRESATPPSGCSTIGSGSPPGLG